MAKTPTTERDAELVEEFLRWMAVEKGRAVNTISNYRRDLTRYVEFLGTASKSLLTARETEVEDYVRVLQASGDANASTARRLAAIRMMHGFLLKATTHPRHRRPPPPSALNLASYLSTLMESV